MALIQRSIQLNEDDVRWFENTYPKASLAAILGLLLEKYRKVATMTPAMYAEIAAQELKEEIE